MTLVSDSEIVIRLLTVTLVSGLIGLEREYHNKPAGLRTNIMVGLGSTLLTIASVRSLELFPEIKSLDPTRIAAQIITGIGFIGAGAILRPSSDKQNVVGLTAAATLWVVCGIGIAIGLGFYFEAILTTLIVFFTFMVLSSIVKWIRHYSSKHPPFWYPEHDDHQKQSVVSSP